MKFPFITLLITLLSYIMLRKIKVNLYLNWLKLLFEMFKLLLLLCFVLRVKLLRRIEQTFRQFKTQIQVLRNINQKWPIIQWSKYKRNVNVVKCTFIRLLKRFYICYCIDVSFCLNSVVAQNSNLSMILASRIGRI